MISPASTFVPKLTARFTMHCDLELDVTEAARLGESARISVTVQLPDAKKLGPLFFGQIEIQSFS